MRPASRRLSPRIRTCCAMPAASLWPTSVNSGANFVEIERFEIAPRPHLAVDLLVANGSETPCPVKAASRRRRWPTASLYGAWRFAKLVHRDRRHSATQSDNFKLVALGEIPAAGDRPGSRHALDPRLSRTPQHSAYRSIYSDKSRAARAALANGAMKATSSQSLESLRSKIRFNGM
jgi:hypothetical protein